MATIETVIPQPVGLSTVGRFLTSAEKADLVESATPLVIEAVVHDAMNRYGARWIISARNLATGELVALSLADTAIRDAQYAALAAAIEAGTPIEPVVLVEVGKKKARTFRTATAAELAAVVGPEPEPAPAAKR